MNIRESDYDSIKKRLEYINSRESPEYSMDELNEYYSKQKKIPTKFKNHNYKSFDELMDWWTNYRKTWDEEDKEYRKNHPDAWKEHPIKGLDEIDFDEFKDIINQQFYDKELEEKIQRESKNSVSNKNTRKNTRSNTKKTLKNKKDLNSNECIIN